MHQAASPVYKQALSFGWKSTIRMMKTRHYIIRAPTLKDAARHLPTSSKKRTSFAYRRHVTWPATARPPFNKYSRLTAPPCSHHNLALLSTITLTRAKERRIFAHTHLTEIQTQPALPSHIQTPTNPTWTDPRSRAQSAITTASLLEKQALAHSHQTH